MTRQTIFTNLFALITATAGCQLITDFSGDETHATAGGSGNRGGEGNKGGAKNKGGGAGMGASSGGTTTSLGGSDSLGDGGPTASGGVGISSTIAPSDGGGSGAITSSAVSGGVDQGGGGTAVGGVPSLGGTTARGGATTGGTVTGGTVAGGTATGGNPSTGEAPACQNTTSSCGTGTNCVVCAGGKTCTSAQCKCPTGTTDCGGTCYDTNTDSSHCGSSCQACGTGQVCNSGACECAKGVYACGGCLAWDFEWGGTSTSPWLAELSPTWSDTGGNGASNALLSHTRYQSANTSLAAPIIIDATTTFTASVAVSPCKTGGTINLAGYQLTAWVYLSSASELPAWQDAFQIDTWGPTGEGDYQVLLWGPISTNAWFKITSTFSSATPVNRIGLRVTPTGSWSGSMYIDDVVITSAL